jgi:hypothetical protein
MAMELAAAVPAPAAAVRGVATASLASAAPMSVSDAYSAGLMSSVMRSANTSVKRKVAASKAGGIP